jgi:hypothetical protein
LGIFIVLILALFPIVLLFDTRFAAVALLVAIVGLYQKSVSKRKPPRKAAVEEKPWQDPWDTNGFST